MAKEVNRALVAQAVIRSVEADFGSAELMCAALACTGAQVVTRMTGALWVPVGGRIEIRLDAAHAGDELLCLGPPDDGYHAWLSNDHTVADFSLWQFGRQGRVLPEYAWASPLELHSVGLRYYAFPRETALVRGLGRSNKSRVSRMANAAIAALEQQN
jgi:hypothetical protein